jgi:hypothetical protein
MMGLINNDSGILLVLRARSVSPFGVPVHCYWIPSLHKAVEMTFSSNENENGIKMNVT